MKKKLIILITALILLTISVLLSDPANFKPVTVFKPGTKVGNLNLSRTPWDIGYADLQSKLATPFYVNLESKSRGVTPEELGISLNRNILAKLTTTCKTRLFRLLCRNTSNEKIDPNTIFSKDDEKLKAFMDELNAEVAFMANNTILSFEDYTFRALSPEASVSVKNDNFLSLDKLAKIITTENFVLDLEITSEDNVELQKEATKELISGISAPLLIKYGGTPIYIPVENVRTFLGTFESDGLSYGYIAQEEIGKYLKEIKEDYSSDEIQILHEESVTAISRAMLFRSANYEINNAVILPLIGNSKTNGELHDEYLELVKSQQRLYRFKNGSLVRTYIVSTGLTWDTPAGKFEVLGKQKMTISYTGNWYMPNYLPIGTIDGYYFGFHEIPYHMDGYGNIYSRDPNTMGSPATGGCIQLTAKDSLEIFDQIPVGTPVYIHE
jgi:hypothetical protein